MHSVLWGSPTLAAAWKRKVRSQHQRWGHWLFLGGLCSESTKKVSPVSTEQYFCLVGAHGPPWAVVHSSVPSCTKPALRFLTQLWAPALPLRPISALPPGGWSWREVPAFPVCPVGPICGEQATGVPVPITKAQSTSPAHLACL